MPEVTASGLRADRKVLVASMPLETSTNQFLADIDFHTSVAGKKRGQHLRSIILTFPTGSYFLLWTADLSGHFHNDCFVNVCNRQYNFVGRLTDFRLTVQCLHLDHRPIEADSHLVQR